MRKEVGHHVDEEGHTACEHFLDGGSAARVRNVIEVELCFALEQNAREMARGAGACGRKGGFAGAGLGVLHEVGCGVHVGKGLGADGENQPDRGEAGDGC